MIKIIKAEILIDFRNFDTNNLEVNDRSGLHQHLSCCGSTAFQNHILSLVLFTSRAVWSSTATQPLMEEVEPLSCDLLKTYMI